MDIGIVVLAPTRGVPTVVRIVRSFPLRHYGDEMRTIIRKNRRSEREVTEWLTVIDEFDQLVADQAALDQLVAAAARLTGRTSGALDALTGRVGQASPGEPAAVVEARSFEDVGLVRSLTASRLRARETGVIDTPRGEVLAASIDDAGGRIGMAWLVGGQSGWRPIDELVVQRLASVVAITSVRLKDHRATRSRLDYAAVEGLLSAPLGPEAAAEAGRRAGLRPGRPYVAVAARVQPGGDMGLDALGQTMVRGLERRGHGARATVIGRAAAIIVEAGPSLDDGLGGALGALAQLGISAEMGVGEPGHMGELSKSWRQASQALVLRPVISPASPVTTFGELGVLHLLAEIPIGDLAQYRDVARLAELDSSGGGMSDLDLLERYLGTMSLRQTARQVHLHYTTVQYRLRRIERQLGIDLGDSTIRLRTQIAILLYRIERAQTVAWSD